MVLVLTWGISRLCNLVIDSVSLFTYHERDMSWIRFALAILAGGILSSLTDWLFMGDLLYKRNNKHPEIWRYPGGKGESKAIACSSPFPFLTCAVFALVTSEFHVRSLDAGLRLAFEIWLIGPLPLILTNSLFMKVQPMIAMAHSLGWLVKLSVAAGAAILFLK